MCATVADVAPRRRRKRLAIFHARDAKPLEPEMMAREVPEEARAGLARLAAANVKAGLGEKNLVLFSEGGAEGFSLIYIWFKSGYVLPPHSHDVDCVYYVLAGELSIGSQRLRKGDGFFVPAETGYTYEAGPDGVEVLEFRNATRFKIRLKGGDVKRWDRIADVFRERAQAWADESTPPSARGAS